MCNQSGIWRWRERTPLVLLEKDRLLALPLVGEHLLPLALAFAVWRGVQRDVAMEARIHLLDVLLGDAEPACDLRDLTGVKIIVQGGDARLGLAQIEEESPPAGRRRDLHQRPGTQDVILDRRSDPKRGVSGETEPAVCVKTPHCLEQ